LTCPLDSSPPVRLKTRLYYERFNSLFRRNFAPAYLFQRTPITQRHNGGNAQLHNTILLRPHQALNIEFQTGCLPIATTVKVSFGGSHATL
jgi:hypothetical protein